MVENLYFASYKTCSAVSCVFPFAAEQQVFMGFISYVLVRGVVIVVLVVHKQARYLLYLYSFLLYIVRSLRSVRALAVVSERDGPTAVEDGALHNVFRAAPRTKLEIGVAIAQAIDNERHTTPSNPFGVLGTVQNLATFYGFKERRLEPTARRGPGGAAAPV